MHFVFNSYHIIDSIRNFYNIKGLFVCLFSYFLAIIHSSSRKTVELSFTIGNNASVTSGSSSTHAIK